MLALAGAAAASTTHLPGEGWSTPALVAALCAAPMLVRVVRRPPADRRGRPLVVAGTVLAGLALVVVGGVGADLTAVQELLSSGTTARTRTASTAGIATPFGWAAGGVALVLGGLAARTGDQVLAGLATAVAALTAGGFAVALVARSVAGSPRTDLTPDAGMALTALLVGAAAVLLVVLAVESAGAPQRPRAGATTTARWAAVTAVVAVLTAGTAWAVVQSSPEAPGPARPLAEVFADDALAACVARAAGRPDATASVTDRDLATIDQLRCDGQDDPRAPIVSLEGIDALTALTALEVPRNAISDLSPLARVTRLSALALTGNQVSDLTPLAGLELFDLGLSLNPISDLTPLAGMTTLRALGASNAQLTDISPLAGHDGLSTLDLSGNAITDVTPLTGLRYLDTLRLARNQIVDPSPLGTIPTLLRLDLFGNRVAAIGRLAEAPLLQELQLGANPLTDLTPLLRTTSLVNLGLDESDGTLMTGIEQLRAAGVSVNGLA